MKLHLIFARSRNGVIGKNNAIPWHLPEDLAHFKRVTLGAPVIMGRNTWDSLPPRFRPLPGRTNVVVTRQPDWHSPGAIPAHALEPALQQCGAATDVWIIGGAQLYTLAMPHASSAVVTEIDIDVEGDTFAPVFPAHWQETAREEHVAASGLGYRFITLQNQSGTRP